jgi:hypothetical protein
MFQVASSRRELPNENHFSRKTIKFFKLNSPSTQFKKAATPSTPRDLVVKDSPRIYAYGFASAFRTPVLLSHKGLAKSSGRIKTDPANVSRPEMLRDVFRLPQESADLERIPF